MPLVLAAGEAGNEIQAPMGIVILGGLLTSTVLNMLVVPVLFKMFGRPSPAQEGKTHDAEGSLSVTAL